MTSEREFRSLIKKAELGVVCDMNICVSNISLQYIFICCLKNEYSVGVYPFKLVSDKEHGIIGSCSSYAVRRDVTGEVRSADGLLTLAAARQRLSSELFIQYIDSCLKFGIFIFELLCVCVWYASEPGIIS